MKWYTKIAGEFVPVILHAPHRSRAWRLLRSPRLALTLLLLTMLYAAVVSWLPWLAGDTMSPPVWAVKLGLDHPFRSIIFLGACGLLFVNTLACTFDRFGRVYRLWRGDVPTCAAQLSGGSAEALCCLLRGAGFRDYGPVYFKNRCALWGGFILHVGILAIILSVAVQQAYYDGGAFEIAEREIVSLDRSGVVFGREAGYLAPRTPPRLNVALDRFDAHLHQHGYAPDRQSRLVVIASDRPDLEVAGTIDRARGLTIGNATIYQAIPSGFALNIEVPEIGVRSVHLREKDRKTAVADVTDPVGEPLRFVMKTENSLSGPEGTGRIIVRIERRGMAQLLQPGESFPFGPGEARLVAISRWGGFTYARTPGIGLVFAGFAIVLAGCFLLVFPTGMARFGKNSASPEVKVYLSRGIDLLLLDWHRRNSQTETYHDSREKNL
jgi:hypothetical protein